MPDIGPHSGNTSGTQRYSLSAVLEEISPSFAPLTFFTASSNRVWFRQGKLYLSRPMRLLFPPASTTRVKVLQASSIRFALLSFLAD